MTAVRQDLNAAQIHELIIARARTVSGFPSDHVYDTPMETWQSTDLPLLAVFLVNELAVSDGNAGEPHFLHTLTIGIQAVVLSSDNEAQRAAINAALGKIDLAILTDPPTLLNIEEVTQMQRQFKYGRTGETPFAQLSSAVSMTFRSRWPPFVPDDFLVLHVQTRFPAGADSNTIAQTQQVVAQWDILQNTNTNG